MTAHACPICNAPATRDHAPFCGAACKDRDLLQWLDEGYRLPGTRADNEALDRPENPD